MGYQKQQQKYPPCVNFIMVSNNFQILESLFEQKKLKSHFGVHKTILIFFEGFHDFQTNNFLLATYLAGLNIIVAEGFIFESKSLLPGVIRKEKNEILVQSVRQNKVLKRWNFKSEFILNKENFKIPRWMPNFNVGEEKNTFKIATYNCPPFTYYTEEKGVYEGLEYRIMQEVIKNWPSEYKIYSGDELFKNIKLEVAAGVRDIGFGSFWDLSTVAYDVDMSFPYSQVCATFLVPKPSLLPYATFVYQPISAEFWFLIVIMLLIMSTIFTFARFVYKSSTRTDFTIGFLYTIRTITCGGIPQFPPPTQYIFRYILTTWCLNALLISTAYSSGLASILSYPRYTKPINSMQDMVDQKIYWMAPETDTWDVYRNSSNPVLKQLVNLFVLEMETYKRNINIRKGNGAIKVQLTARSFIDAEDLDSYGKTHLKLLPECAGAYALIYAFKKGSVYTKIFDHAIKMFLEHGFINVWANSISQLSHMLDIKNFQGSYSVQLLKFHNLSIEELQGAFHLLIFGLICAVFFFILEYFIYKYF